jgi:LmbE family N-acetylglucosaminyl deacetylase
MRQLVCGLLFLIPIFTGLSQSPPPQIDAMPAVPDRGAAGMARWLRALQTRASLLMFTAHPDDEDGGMLAYEVRGQGARAALMTLTRGEGGQNVMSQDFYDALGLARTQELLIADRYMGVEQYFSLGIDYGFSKTREEALEKWGYDRVLSDSVRVVRMMRPLVVMSVFMGAATDGHGNHQVAGQMAQEVFNAAGDPTKFPEQIREGLRPWSPLKVYARVPMFQATAEGMYDYAIDKFVPVRFFDYVNQKAFTQGPDTTLEIPEGLAAPAAGLTFLQTAREGLGFQKTQNGGGAIPQAAPFNSAYHRFGSRVAAAGHETSFFDGIDVSIQGIATLAAGEPKFLKDGLAAIAKPAADALREYRVDRPSAIAPVLAEGLKQTRALMSQVQSGSIAEPGKSDVLFELGLKERQFEKALAAALEISFQTVVAAASPGGRRGAPSQTATEAAFAAARGGRGDAPTFTIAIPEQSFNVEAQMFNEGLEPLGVDCVKLEASDGKNWGFRTEGSPVREIAAGKEAQWRIRSDHAARCGVDAALFQPPERRAAILRSDRRALSQSALRAISARCAGPRGLPRSGVRHRRGGADQRARSRLRHNRKSAAHGACDLGLGFAIGRRRAHGIEIVRVHHDGSQQRKRPGKRNATLETALRMARDSAAVSVFLRAGGRGSDGYILRVAGHCEAGRIRDHRRRGIQRTRIFGGVSSRRISGIAPVSLLSSVDV